MRKKTFKIFVNSFVISLFVIWTTNKLFAVPQAAGGKDISIPEKNIALFFQQEAPMVNYATSTPVQSFSLVAPTPKANERDLMIDEGLFVFDDAEDDHKETEKGVLISSIEDVADIPLESQVEENSHSTSRAESTLVVKSESSSNKLFGQASKASSSTSATENNIQKIAIAGDEATIPLEFSSNKTNQEVEIASQAPENQIAMADGGKVDLNSIAVDQKAVSTAQTGKEWYQMSEKNSETSPWVVARGTRNPKNNHVLDEDFYKGLSESEITAALNSPKTMAEDTKEVQVAEMVKNILIPIPEDILNDKNLTPQLVSPKKTQKEQDSQSDTESAVTEEPKQEGGILKSLTSMFSSSDDTQISEDTAVAEEEDSTPQKRRGLFSAFTEKKSSAKILPAEMRLSFQPGRAEISGTTLRWIQAFANKVIEDPSVVLEIRIDQTSSFELQQKRLNLLHNILTNKGVDYGRISTVFTSREPNSFIIRTLRINDNVNNTVQENKKGQSLYYQSW